MAQYAIKIRKSDLDLLTLLNNGVTPEIESTTTYLIIDSDPVNAVPNEIVTEREFLQRFNISSRSPLLLRLKQ